VGDFEIYTMNPDGTGVVQVTNNTIVDSDSDWGPVLAAGPNPAGPVGGVVDVVVATDGGGSTRWVVVSLMLALPMVFWRLRAGSSDPQPV
jgi:hypothetical protein